MNIPTSTSILLRAFFGFSLFHVTHSQNNEPCLQSCSNGLTAKILQKCVDKCVLLEHCCGNRLDEDGDFYSSNQRLSCANGCEIAYYSKTLDECKGHCSAGNEPGCDYQHPFTSTFEKCGSCSTYCSSWPSPGACADGCDEALNFNQFYKFEESCEPEVMPRFLFAGQSNMVGHPDENYEGEGDENLFSKLVDIMNSNFNSGNKKKKMIKEMKKEIEKTGECDENCVKNEAKFTYKLKKYMKNKIKKDHKKIVCSFTDPSRQSKLDCERPVSPTACGGGDGKQFGPELMFAHHFTSLKTPYKGEKVGIVKVAEGGTNINSNWMKDNDGGEKNHWQLLVDAIDASKGSIEAFVWFQGENDSFDEDNYDNYFDNLTKFVSDVRSEIFKGSNKFTAASDIPVIIVELGCWIYCSDDISNKVIEAQREFVESDKKALLVETGGTDDEKKRFTAYYHFDAAAILIIGSRIAKQVAKLV